MAFIKNWYDEKITTIDFTKALYDIKDGSTFINSKASQLVFFMQKFNFACPDETKLDMLCFAHSDDVLNFTDIASSLPKNMVDNRIVHHIKDHIVKYDTIYYKHGLIENFKSINKKFQDNLQIFIGSALRNFSEVTDPSKSEIKEEDAFLF